MINDQHVVVPSMSTRLYKQKRSSSSTLSCPVARMCWRLARSLFGGGRAVEEKTRGAISRKQPVLLGPAMIKLEDAAG